MKEVSIKMYRIIVNGKLKEVIYTKTYQEAKNYAHAKYGKNVKVEIAPKI